MGIDQSARAHWWGVDAAARTWRLSCVRRWPEFVSGVFPERVRLAFRSVHRYGPEVGMERESRVRRKLGRGREKSHSIVRFPPSNDHGVDIDPKRKRERATKEGEGRDRFRAVVHRVGTSRLRRFFVDFFSGVRKVRRQPRSCSPF